MKVRDGKPFGNRKSAADTFADINVSDFGGGDDDSSDDDSDDDSGNFGD